VNEWVWSIGGMVLTGEISSTGRETLYSVGGRWMNVYGALVEWYWQGKTEVLGEKHYIAWVVGEWMGMEHWWNGIGKGKLKYWERNLSHCHFVHHKSHMAVMTGSCPAPIKAQPRQLHGGTTEHNGWSPVRKAIFLTNSTENSCFWDAKRSSGSRILRNPKVHYHINNSPPPVSIPSQIIPAHASTHFLKTHCTIMLPPTTRSSKRSLSLFTLPVSQACHTSCPSGNVRNSNKGLMHHHHTDLLGEWCTGGCEQERGC